jgi:Leucine-rich repeat (LRR) protein
MSHFDRGARNESFFNQHHVKGASSVATNGQAINASLRACHTSGVLSLTNRNLSDVPLQIFSTSLDEGEKFWEAVPLGKLDLSFNQISVLPEEVALLQELTSLKMRSNCLTAIPRALFQSCSSLRHLDFGQNKLNALDASISNLEQLSELILAENMISVIPPHLELCLQLQVLNLYSNKLSVLPDVRLPQLRELNVGNNNLATLPASLCHCSRLEIFVCSRNKIAVLPDLSGMACLSILDAMGNQLRHFPILAAPLPGRTRAEPGKASDVSKTVAADRQGIRASADMEVGSRPGRADKSNPSLSSSVSSRGGGVGGASLSVINLGHNAIDSISGEALASLSLQTNISELLLSNNKLSELPDVVFRLQKLKLLDVSNNNLADVPYSLGYIDALQIINLEGNPIRTIRRTLIARSEANLTQDLKKFLRSRGDVPIMDGGESSHANDGGRSAPSSDALDFRVRDIAEGGVLNWSKMISNAGGSVPPNIFKKLFDSHTLQSLTSVNFSDNALQEIPVQLKDIRTLKVLTLAKNRLSAGLSARLWAPSSLRVLDVSENNLCSEQAELILDGASFLSSINISRNSLDHVPRNIVDVVSLRELNLSFNKVTSLASIRVYGLPNLEVLNLSNNRLKEVGHIQPEKSRLRVVDFSNNDLVDVPFQFGFIETLHSLSLQGNSIRLLRQAIINGPFEGLKQALKNKAPQ